MSSKLMSKGRVKQRLTQDKLKLLWKAKAEVDQEEPPKKEEEEAVVLETASHS